jgi:hypothetical protein
MSTGSGRIGKELSLLHHRRRRRRSSWGGRPARPDGAHDDDDARGGARRKSAGGLLIDQAQEGSDDDGGGDDGQEGKRRTLGVGPPGHDTLASLGDIGRMAAELSIPTLPPRPRLGSSSGGGAGGDDEGGREDTGHTDVEEELGARRAGEEEGGVWVDKKPRGSPRSPRVLAADQAAMMDALLVGDPSKADDGDAPSSSPVAGAEVDAPALAFGFEDPLGANRLVEDLPGRDQEGREEVELEGQEKGEGGTP